MNKRTLLLLALFALVLGISLAKETADVCILGAGASGLNMAWMLKDRGKDVVVFEKRNRVGGHCESLRFTFPNGTQGAIETGVVIFPNTTQAEALGYGQWGFSMEGIVRRFAGSDSVIETPFNGLSSYSANLETGEDYGVLQFQVGEDFGPALGNLFNIMATDYPWMETAVDIPPQIPAELLLPFTDWIALKGLQPLYLLFNNSLFYGGQGDLSKINAYAALLQVGTRTDLMYQTLPSPQGWFSIRNGCISMYEGIVSYVGQQNIKLGVTIESVMRNGRGPVRIQYRQHSGGNHHRNNNNNNNNNRIYVQKCDKVVVAFPPTQENLHAFTLTNKEASLFSGIRQYQVLVASAELSGPAVDNGAKFRIINANRNNFLYQPTLPALGGTYRYNSYGPSLVNAIGSPDNVPFSQLESVMRVGATMFPPTLITQVRFERFFPHLYNPVFSDAKLAEVPNPFLQLDALQGEKNTYWVGALRSTANTGYLIKSLVELLKTHFL